MFSCLIILLSFYLGGFEAVDDGYLDLSKAFNRSPHEKLIGGVWAHGIGGNVLKWVKEWIGDGKWGVHEQRGVEVVPIECLPHIFIHPVSRLSFGCGKALQHTTCLVNLN